MKWQGPLEGSDQLEEELSQQRSQKDRAPLKKTPDMSLDRHLVGQSRAWSGIEGDGGCRTEKPHQSLVDSSKIVFILGIRNNLAMRMACDKLCCRLVA